MTIGLQDYIENNSIINLLKEHENNKKKKKLDSVTKEAKKYKNESNNENNMDADSPTKVIKKAENKAKYQNVIWSMAPPFPVVNTHLLIEELI